MQAKNVSQQDSVNLDNIKNIIMVLSGKGGVGKSTVSASLARSLSEKGYKVGLLDADFHGPTIPQLFGVDGSKVGATEDERIIPLEVSKNFKLLSTAFMTNKEDPVIWRGPLKMKAIKQFLNAQWGELDYLIVDLPPGTGDEPLSIGQQVESDGAVIVTTPQIVSVSNVRRSISFAEKLDIPVLGVIENMSGFICPHCGEKTNIFKQGGGKKISEEFNIDLLGKIPLDPKIVESGEKGESFLDNDNETTKAFENIIKNLKAKLSKE